MLNKKVAIVTGGTRGIGKAIVLALIEANFMVVSVGTKEASSFVVANLFYIQGNIGNEQSRKMIVDTTLAKFGRIDVLVNNAGVSPLTRVDILETSEESFDYVMDINLKGTFFLTQYVAKRMIKLIETTHLKPIIINIASISSNTSSVNRSEYCISKAGISMVTQLFADRLAEYPINVYEIRPGIIMTDMTSPAKEKYDVLIKNGLSPIKRWGKPEDVSQAVVVLAEGKLPFSTGEVIYVDGGLHIRRL